jgi:proteic killer suppression protein
MIKNFKHKGLKNFFNSGSTKGINFKHANKINRQLAVLNRAIKPEDINIPGWALHPLSGKLLGYWAIKVNGNWRIIFKFEGSNIILVDYKDYH